MSNEKKFEKHVLAKLDEAENAIGNYRFSGLRNLIENLGAVKAAKMLVNLDSLNSEYDGFEILLQRGLEHLSIEQAMIDFADSGLFEDGEIAVAQSRLLIASQRKHRKS